MISKEGYERLAKSVQGGIWETREEDYQEVEYLARSAFEELSQALQLDGALNQDGFDYLVQITEDLKKFLQNFDSLKIIPLR